LKIITGGGTCTDWFMIRQCVQSSFDAFESLQSSEWHSVLIKPIPSHFTTKLYENENRQKRIAICNSGFFKSDELNIYILRNDFKRNTPRDILPENFDYKRILKERLFTGNSKGKAKKNEGNEIYPKIKKMPGLRSIIYVF